MFANREREHVLCKMPLFLDLLTDDGKGAEWVTSPFGAKMSHLHSSDSPME